jgi:hypothetical protein
LPATVISSSVSLVWSATDSGSGVASFDVRYRRARYNGGFASWTYPASWQATTSFGGKLSLASGYDYCVQVRARDTAGNLSGWSSPRCTARALDDRALSFSSGWSRRTGRGYYRGTVTATRTKGAALTLKAAELDRVALVATRCSGCGSIAIYVGSHLIGKVSLAASRTHRRQIIAFPRFSYRKGAIMIRTLAAKPVQIDGIAISRT